MEAIKAFVLLNSVHLGPGDLLNSSSRKEVPPDHCKTLFSNAGCSGEVDNSASRPALLPARGSSTATHE